MENLSTDEYDHEDLYNLQTRSNDDSLDIWSNTHQDEEAFATDSQVTNFEGNRKDNIYF